MPTTLEDIRFLVEEDVGDSITNELTIKWGNDAQADFSQRVLIPASTNITLDITSLEYTLPANFYEIKLLRLQSDIDTGHDRSFRPDYRLYNGKFIVPQPFSQADTMVMDYYKTLTYFDDITDVIDIEDRFTPLYTFYMQAKYYTLPKARQQYGEGPARELSGQNFSSYLEVKKQVAGYYNLRDGIRTVQESW